MRGNIRDPVLLSYSVRQKEPLHQDDEKLPSRRTDVNFSTCSMVLGKKLIYRSDSRYEIWGTKGYIFQQIGRNKKLSGFPSIDLERGWNPTVESSRFWHYRSPKKNGRNSFTTSGRSIPLCKFLVTSKEVTMAEERFNWLI
ncbi:hypothetical protein GIB67_004803 [Kingdonia uniflora]|uniref:Uncharacterized protein n=1 Tax=Kingdonia uniflora TaxID=39325 RepID=A0A7J7LNL0_9MAGN|nr:hypothetical protein GIB67_004803 [Kingdonia uniflora]